MAPPELLSKCRREGEKLDVFQISPLEIDLRDGKKIVENCSPTRARFESGVVCPRLDDPRSIGTISNGFR
jgi:hypothetical protein